MQAHVIPRKKMEQDFPNLPPEIIFDILSILPVKPLCRFKSVSKPWLALITDPQFIKSHLHHQSKIDKVNQKLIMNFCNSISFYSLDCRATDRTLAKLELPCDSQGQLLGSLNGVLLIALGIGDQLCKWNPPIRRYQLCIWNPSIRRCHMFSQPEYRAGDIPIYGLGYDSISDDFKVVRVISLMNNHDHGYDSFAMSEPSYAVHVFSSKLSSWKSIGDFGYTTHKYSPVTIMNGAPHLVVGHRTVSDKNFSLTDLIVCFDATEEKFKEVPMPSCKGVNYFNISLGVLGGWLCMTKDHLWSHVDVWMMKEYGVKESWTKLFLVPYVLEGDFYFENIKLLGYTKDGEVLMLFDLIKLVIYDPKQNKCKRIFGIPKNYEWFHVDSYVESLVSCYGYDDTRRHR